MRRPLVLLSTALLTLALAWPAIAIGPLIGPSSQYHNAYRVDLQINDPKLQRRDASAIVREGADATVLLATQDAKQGGSPGNIKVQFSVVADETLSKQMNRPVVNVHAKISKYDPSGSWTEISSPALTVLADASIPATLKIGPSAGSPTQFDFAAKATLVPLNQLQQQCAAVSGQATDKVDLKSALAKLDKKQVAAAGVSCCCTAPCTRGNGLTLWCCNVICCSESTSCRASCCVQSNCTG